MIERSRRRGRLERILIAASATGLWLFSVPGTAAEPGAAERGGYSYFGIGLDLLDYEESTTRRVGGETIDVETENTGNLTQQSGAYVAIDRDWGFYLTSSSTLGQNRESESWEAAGTTIRTNRVTFERQRLDLMATLRADEYETWLFGGAYNSIEFQRFAPQLTAAAADLGVTATTFEDGTVSEQVWDLSVVGGYEWSNLFARQGEGWRYRLQMLVGIPLTTQITNTEINEGSAFTDSFNGLSLRANWVYGYQFSKHAIAAFAVDAGLSYRQSINRDIADSAGVTEFPETVLGYVFPSFTAIWSF